MQLHEMSLIYDVMVDVFTTWYVQMRKGMDRSYEGNLPSNGHDDSSPFKVIN